MNITIPSRISTWKLCEYPLDSGLTVLLNHLSVNRFCDLEASEGLLREYLDSENCQEGFKERVYALVALVGGTVTEGPPGAESLDRPSPDDLAGPSPFQSLAEGSNGSFEFTEDLHKVPIPFSILKVRTANLLEQMQVSTLEDLHGKPFQAFYGLKGSGKTSWADLAKALRNLVENPEAYAQTDPQTITVPAFAEDWPLEQLPFSVRTLSGLQENITVPDPHHNGPSRKAAFLGDIKGYSYTEMRKWTNFGKKSVKNCSEVLADIGNGVYGRNSVEEGFEEVSTYNAALVFLQSQMTAALQSDSNRKLKERFILGKSYAPGEFDGKACPFATLDEIGKAHNVTRECVRQVLEKTREQILKQAGPRLHQAIRTVKEELEANNLPLQTDHGTTVFALFLDEEIPVPFLRPRDLRLPPPQTGQPLNDTIDTYLREFPKGTRLQDMCRMVRKTHKDLTAAQFYQEVFSLPYDFSTHSDRTQFLSMRPSTLYAEDLVLKILESSETPMPVEDILQVANQTSDKNYSEGTFLNLAHYESDKGIYLLDANTLGLKKHIRIPDGLWKLIWDDFASFLQEQPERQGSVYNFLADPPYGFLEDSSAYEINAVLLLEPENRFTPVKGKMQYSLSEESIPD